ncbi:MAG: hypothetical protein ACI4R8_03615 [Candidatus Caccovivens sp.]
MNYFRITGYCPQYDFCFIADCFGKFEKLWQFSSMFVVKNLNVLEVGTDNKFLDVNIKRATEDTENIILRANAKGKPEYITQEIDGMKYEAIRVADKIYVPDKTKTI